MISYAGQDYLTTMSHLRLVASEDGVHFREHAVPHTAGAGYFGGPFLARAIWNRMASRIAAWSRSATPITSPSPRSRRTAWAWGFAAPATGVNFRQHGMIFPPHNKDCAIFAEKIGGRYYALHRPSSPELGGNYIWIAESPDLDHWGNHRCIAHSRKGMWDSARVGAGGAPIRTPQGWLEIYHGATANPTRYCLGALLLDLDEPWKVLARSNDPIMEPLADYEQVGFFGNVVFTNGHLVDGDEVTIYYGASDSVICGAKILDC